MKRTGILHHELSAVISSLGHLDLVVIGDAGLPVAPGVQRIELALGPDLPTVIQVLELLLHEAIFEKLTIAEEQLKASPRYHTRLLEVADRNAIPLESLPHMTGFKPLATRARVHIRTGDFTPYSNVILTAGWIGRPTQPDGAGDRGFGVADSWKGER
jgi:D-ribose pyranase